MCHCEDQAAEHTTADDIDDRNVLSHAKKSSPSEQETGLRFWPADAWGAWTMTRRPNACLFSGFRDERFNGLYLI